MYFVCTAYQVKDTIGTILPKHQKLWPLEIQFNTITVALAVFCVETNPIELNWDYESSISATAQSVNGKRFRSTSIENFLECPVSRIQFSILNVFRRCKVRTPR